MSIPETNPFVYQWKVSYSDGSTMMEFENNGSHNTLNEAKDYHNYSPVVSGSWVPFTKEEEDIINSIDGNPYVVANDELPTTTVNADGIHFIYLMRRIVMADTRLTRVYVIGKSEDAEQFSVVDDKGNVKNVPDKRFHNL